MTAKEAAEYLGLTVKRLNTYRYDGGGPRYTKANNVSKWARCVYERADLDAWKARQRGKRRA